MSNNVIGKIPDFDTDDVPKDGEEVSELSSEEPVEPSTGEEKEIPSEPPAEQPPASVEKQTTLSEDIGALKTELQREVEGLRKAREDLILELGDLRGQRRAAKEAEIKQIEENIDDLKDLHPQDVELIERVLKAKGYVRQENVNHIIYQSTKRQEIDRFLSEYPEYNEQNDPDRKKLGPILKEVSLYKEPDDPALYGVLLRKAHRAISGVQVTSERGETPALKKRQVQIASAGSGGSQRSSFVTPFDSVKRQRLLDGGWSEEDIQRMEKRQQ